MAQSYEIYIRDKTGGAGKPTQPRKGGNSNTSSSKKKSNGEKDDNKLSGLMAAAKNTTAGKILLAVYAAGKVAKGVVDTMIPFITRETGDYRFATAWNNAWQSVKNYTKPVSYIMGVVTYNQETMLINQRQEQQRLLVGDSFINDSSRKM